jgi:hypothetical protein
MRLFFLHQHRSEEEARAAAAVPAPAAPAALRNDTAVGLPPSGAPGVAAAAAAAAMAALTPQPLPRSPLAATAAAAGLLSPSPPPHGLPAGGLGRHSDPGGASWATAGGYGGVAAFAPALQQEPNVGSTGTTAAGLGSADDEGPVILHVSGLVEGVTREQLRELFGQAGEVTKVDIPDGGRSMVSMARARPVQ